MTPPHWFQRLVCRVFGHDWVPVSDRTADVLCLRCGARYQPMPWPSPPPPYYREVFGRKGRPYDP